MSDPYSRRILAHLADRRYLPTQLRHLAQELGITSDQMAEFRIAIRQLLENGQIVLGAADTVVLPPPGPEMVGVFRLTDRGFGFVVPDTLTQHGDLFIPPGNTGGALTGDRVRARVTHDTRRSREPGRSPYVGRIVQIIQRADNRYVGTLEKKGGSWFVTVDAGRLPTPVLIRDPHAKNATAGDKVVLEIVSYGGPHEIPQGVITEVIGLGGEPSVETLAVMRSYGLPEKFPTEVLEDARAVIAGFHEHAIPPSREDLTDQFICTIDPPDAKDFDDAISVRRLDPRAEPDRAAYELGVHIADVSHFVQPGTPLDREAYARGTSVYLPRRVVPMLPELLSNGVCSLQEGVHRLTKSVFIRYDDSASVVNERFTRSVIRSAKRLTYLEAQALIDGDFDEARKHNATEPHYSHRLVDQLRLMDELARLLRHRRLKAGMLVLDLPEVELVFDDSGRVIDAVPQDDAFTHTIIEMLMVETNEALARLFHNLGLPMVRRVHPDPGAHDLKDLRRFTSIAGYNIPARPTRAQLQQLLDAVRGQPAQYPVHLAVLKTLSKAEYSPHLFGHFALASEHYTHFTSPIRRYPDLVVHRALDAVLDLQPQRTSRRKPKHAGTKQLAAKLRLDPRCPDEHTLTQISRHCSLTERNAEAAEHELRDYLVLDLLAKHIGEDYDGTVTGVSTSGIFVQLDRYLVDGFVALADLPGSHRGKGRANPWKFNRNTGALVAQKSGQTITIGDRFLVRVTAVDPAARKLDLSIVEHKPSRPRSTKQPLKPHRRNAGAKNKRAPNRKHRRR